MLNPLRKWIQALSSFLYLWTLLPNAFGPFVKGYLVRKMMDHEFNFSAQDIANFAKGGEPIETLASVIEDQDIEYIFISAKVYYNQIRIAQWIREVKPQAKFLHISLDPGSIEDHEIFSHAVHLNLIQTTALLKAIQGKRIFTQGWLFRYHIVSVIQHNLGNNAHVLDIMDLNSFIFPRPLSKHVAQLMKITWGDDVLSNQRAQEVAEQYLLNNAGRVLFPGSAHHYSPLNIERERLYKHFFPYGAFPLRSNFAVPVLEQPGKNVRLAFAGGIPPFDERRIPEFFKDAHMITTLEMIFSRGGVTVDLYNNPKGYDPDLYKKMYQPHYDLMEKFPDRYRFQRGDHPEVITKTLSQYDFGLMVYDFSGLLFGDPHFDCMIPTKFYLYMEACLPVIVSNKWISVSEVVQKYDLGLVISEDQISSIADIVKDVDVVALKKNVAAYRELICSSNMHRNALL